MAKAAKKYETYLCILSARLRTSIGRFKTFEAGQVYDRKEIPDGGCETKEKKDIKGAVVGHEDPVPSPVYFTPVEVGIDLADKAPATTQETTTPEEVTPDAD